MGDILEFSCDRLFPNTDFIIGMGSVFNLSGNYFEFNRSNSPQEADYRAIKSDWLAVGKDLEYAIENDK